MDSRKMVCRTTESDLLPFLKWPGGKRWFVGKHLSEVPSFGGTYFEPFLGSASLFFALRPPKAILSDMNGELVNVYRVMKSRPHKLFSLLQGHASKHSEQHYYSIRADVPKSTIEKAARFLYLNRSCFNGIYRVNARGEFNVPKGSKEKIILDGDDFGAISKQLRASEICVSDFEAIIDQAQGNDLIFADPPYTVRHNNNGFRSYNEKLFSWQDQERLAASLERATKRGAKVIATNANHASVKELFESHGFVTHPTSRFSSISGKGGARKMYEELIIRDAFSTNG